MLPPPISEVSMTQRKPTPLVTIKHGPIGDVTPAMTMEYEIPEKQGVEGLKRGDTVSFELSESLEIIQISKK